MRKLVPLVAAACVATLSSVTFAEDAKQEEAKQSEKTPRTLVTIDGMPLTELDFALYRSQQGSAGDKSPQSQMMTLNQLINTTMLANSALADGLDKHVEVSTATRIARDRVLAEVAIRNYLKNNPITDEDLKKEYDEQFAAGSPSTEFNARHILVKTQEEATDLVTKLNDGGDFAELAKEHSTGPTGANGGDLGWFGSDQMVQPFSEAVAKLEKGKYTAEPVQTRFGWHVIKLEDKRDSPAPSMEEVRPQLMTSMQRKRAATFMGQIRENTKIEVQDALKKAPTADGADAAAPAVAPASDNQNHAD